MRELPRRTVLATGVALTTGSVLGSKGIGAIDANTGSAGELPDSTIDPNPGMDETWASYQGDAGHARYIDDGYEFDGTSLETVWSIEYAGSIAVADDTVFTANTNGAAAVDAEDGSVIWANTDVDARDPVVVGDSVYLTGAEIIALDRSDGSVRWETEFNTEGSINGHTVAYDGVYVVVDGTLYALEADDGSIRWERDEMVNHETDGDEEDVNAFSRTPSAANGVVYAGTEGGTFAFDPDIGDEIWRHEWEHDSPTTGTIRATSTAVIDEFDWYSEVVIDAYTGELIDRVPTEGVDVTLGTEMALGGSDHTFEAQSIDGSEHHWQTDIYYEGGAPVISGDTVYNFFGDASDGMSSYPEYADELVALNKYDGTEKWALSTEEMPVGTIRAISGETMYVEHEGELVVLREETNEGDGTDDDQEDDDTDEDGKENGDEGEDGEEDSDEESGDDESGDDSCPDDDGGGCPDDDETDGGEDTAGSSDGGGDGDTDDGTGGSSDDGDAGEADESASQTGQSAADDGMPGFTIGAGALSGLLGLEWLRRRADTDESTEK